MRNDLGPQAGARHGFQSSVGLLLLALAGCHFGDYQASSLPPELAVPPVVSLDSFRLTQLKAPIDHAEMIHPGDKLQVTLATGDDEAKPASWDLEVAEDGSIAVPFVGPLCVAGLTPLSAAGAIREASIRRGIYVNPVVSVAVAERKMNQVTVLGAVQKPGVYGLPGSDSYLCAALVAAGGLREEASPWVEIQNPPGPEPARLSAAPREAKVQAAFTGSEAGGRFVTSPQPVRVNLLDAAAGSGSTTSPAAQYLHDGAVVTVLEQPKRYITLIGLTGNQVMPLPPGRQMRLLDALASAGGTKYSIWIADKVKVIRQVPGTGETVTILASIRKAKRNRAENIPLAAGDLVSVEENIFTFTIDTVSALLGVGISAARVGTGVY